jgi:hypothetical protein
MKSELMASLEKGYNHQALAGVLIEEQEWDATIKVAEDMSDWRIPSNKSCAASQRKRRSLPNVKEKEMEPSLSSLPSFQPSSASLPEAR